MVLQVGGLDGLDWLGWMDFWVGGSIEHLKVLIVKEIGKKFPPVTLFVLTNSFT